MGCGWRDVGAASVLSCGGRLGRDTACVSNVDRGVQRIANDALLAGRFRITALPSRSSCSQLICCCNQQLLAVRTGMMHRGGPKKDGARTMGARTVALAEESACRSGCRCDTLGQVHPGRRGGLVETPKNKSMHGSPRRCWSSMEHQSFGPRDLGRSS